MTVTHTPTFHVVTTGRLSSEDLCSILQRIHPYVDAIHIREKEKTAIELYRLIESLQQSAVPLEKLIVNDRVDVAVLSKIWGVQLAYHSLEVEVVKQEFLNLHVGKSVHSLQEGLEAEKQGADFLLYGHIYHTNSKQNLQPRGIHGLETIARSVRVPVIALGGIQPHHVQEVMEAGAHGIAVMSGVFQSPNPFERVKQYQSELLKWSEKR